MLWYLKGKSFSEVVAKFKDLGFCNPIYNIGDNEIAFSHQKDEKLCVIIKKTQPLIKVWNKARKQMCYYWDAYHSKAHEKIDTLVESFRK